MYSLAQPAVATTLARLFAAAETSARALREEMTRAPEARAAFMALARTDYRAAYGRVSASYLAVSEQTGKLLYLLARASKARHIVEYGTSFGVSTLHLAAAVKDNGGGRVIGSEFETEKVMAARANAAAAGLSELVEIREGDALETLARDLPERIDLVLLDGAKVLYPQVLALLEPRLAPAALIVADNADDSPEYLAVVRGSASYASVAFADDVELSQFIGR